MFMCHFKGKPRNAHAPCDVTGHPKPHIWNQRPQFVYTLYNFYGATTAIKGSLHGSTPIVKRFFSQSRQKRAPNGSFRELRCVNVIFLFSNPKRHILARNRVVWRITRENRFWGQAVGRWKDPEKRRSRVNIFYAQFRAYGEKKPLEGSSLNFACWEISRTSLRVQLLVMIG